MSAELLEKFIESVDQDDGFHRKSKDKKKKSQSAVVAQKILNAANRGQVELPEEEGFLVERKSKKNKRKSNNDVKLNVRLAAQGYSLIDQIREEKPKDLLKRNIKYMKYSDSRKLDDKKVLDMMKKHYTSLPKKYLVRKERGKLTCLRDPKKVAKKTKSVFSEKDFQNVKKVAKVPRKVIQSEDGTFL